MTVSHAQLRTLRLLYRKAAYRIHRTHRAGDYTWMHEDTRLPLTPTLHRLFAKGYATVSPENPDAAVLTDKGRDVVAAKGW